MITMTSTTPTTPARIPSLIESSPSDAPMARSSTIWSGAGRAPARSTRARSLASCKGLVPSSIIPRELIWLLMTGGWPCTRSEEHTSELQSHHDLVCRLLLEKKKITASIEYEIKKERKNNREIA